MVSFGRAPVLTSTPINQRHSMQPDKSRTNIQPMAIQSLERQSGDTIQKKHQVQFGGRALSNPLFQPLIEQGYRPFVADSPEDIQDLLNFLDQMFPPAFLPAEREEQIQDFQGLIDRHNPIYLIRDAKNQIVGSAAMFIGQRPENGQLGSEIYGLAVAPEHRRKGIATTMIQGLIAEAKQRQLSDIEGFTTNPEVKKHAKRYGFRKAGTLKDKNGEKKHHVTLDLTNPPSAKGKVKSLLARMFPCVAGITQQLLPQP